MNVTDNKILITAIDLWGKNTSTTLDDIAKHVGISRRTLHRHFDGRKDLVLSVMNYIVREYLETIEEILSEENLSPLLKLKKLFFKDIRSADRYLVYKNLLVKELPDFANENKDVLRLHQLYHSFFAKIKKDSSIADYVTVEWLEVFYSSIIEASIKIIHIKDDNEKYSQIAWQSFWNGIKKTEGENYDF